MDSSHRFIPMPLRATPRHFTVMDLQPGMTFDLGGGKGTFITMSRHPLHPGFMLVVWWLITERRYSFDSLSPRMELPGNLETSDPHKWLTALQEALDAQRSL